MLLQHHLKSWFPLCGPLRSQGAAGNVLTHFLLSP